MKKIFLMLLGIAATINAMAVDYTASAMVRVTSNTGYYSDFYYSESASLGALNGNTMNFEGRNVALYALNGTAKLQIIEGADLEGVQLGLMTDNGTDYTFNVSYVEGTNPLYLMDSETGVNYLLDGTSFTIENLPTNSTIEDRFTLGRPSAPVTGYTVTPNTAGYATFSAAEATEIPAGATAYTGTISDEELLLNQITGNYVPANTGVIVAGVAGTPYNFAIYNGSVAAIDDNDLKATSTYNTSMQNVYVLKGEAFLEYIGTTALKANKAFIQLPAQSGASAPSRIRMVVNHATGVENAAVEVKAEKFVENGQVLIKRGEIIYNVQGQIVK